VDRVFPEEIEQTEAEEIMVEEENSIDKKAKELHKYDEIKVF